MVVVELFKGFYTGGGVKVEGLELTGIQRCEGSGGDGGMSTKGDVDNRQ